VEAFAGVSCLPCLAALRPDAAVLDLGCGAGLDSLLVAKTGAAVLGIDFSQEMLSRGRRSAEAMGLRNVRFELGDAEAIPVKSGSLEAALVNGLFNLNPARDQIFLELARVIRPGGELFAAQLVLKGPRRHMAKSSDVDWFA
jgi:ubiquinone/menaquinone biosynthesis C-methylase UbiE